MVGALGVGVPRQCRRRDVAHFPSREHTPKGDKKGQISPCLDPKSGSAALQLPTSQHADSAVYKQIVVYMPVLVYNGALSYEPGFYNALVMHRINRKTASQLSSNFDRGCLGGARFDDLLSEQGRKMKSKIETLQKRRNTLVGGGGPARVEKQHALGKLTARERLALLFDPDTFQESHLFMKNRTTRFGMDKKSFPGEGVVTGVGLVGERAVYAASQDFTVAGGSVGEATAAKIADVMDQALATGDPFVFVNDSGGARIQEGVDALAGYGKIFYRNILLSGVVPQISIISGPCAGGGRLLTSAHGFHYPGAQRGADVHHRTLCDPASDRGESDGGGARWRIQPRSLLWGDSFCRREWSPRD